MDVLSNMARENHNLSLGDASWSIRTPFFPLLCVPGLFKATSAVHLSSWGSWPFSCSHHPDENHLASKVKGKKTILPQKIATTPGDSNFKPWPFFYPKTLGLSLNQPSPKGSRELTILKWRSKWQWSVNLVEDVRIDPLEISQRKTLQEEAAVWHPKPMPCEI